MQVWQQLVLLWLVFAASHMVLSHPPIRQALMEQMGGKAFMGVYSLISLAIFVPLVWLYLENRHQGPLLWNLVAVPGVKHFAMLLAVIGIAGVVAGYSQPAATSIVSKSQAPYGLTRITRHPLFMALGLWGLSHCLINGFASDVAFFAGFPIFAIVGCAHQDARKRLDARFNSYFAYTSFWPFGAQISRRGGLVVAELPWLWLLVGVVVALGMFMAHNALFLS